jgi:hypothetical protein
MTGKGLRLEMLVKRENPDNLLSTPRFLVPLNCMNRETLQPIALTLDGWGSTLERRPSVTLLDKYWLEENADGIHRRLIFVKQIFSAPLLPTIPPSWPSYRIHVGIKFEPLAVAGFSIGDAWCRGARLGLKQTRSSIEYYTSLRCWGKLDDLAKNSASSISFHRGDEILVVVFGFCTMHTRGGFWIDLAYNVIVNDTPLSAKYVGRKLCKKWSGKIGPDRLSLCLLDGTNLSLALKRQQASHGLQHMIYIDRKLSEPAQDPFSVGQKVGGVSKMMQVRHAEEHKHPHQQPLSTLSNNVESKSRDLLQDSRITGDDN